VSPELRHLTAADVRRVPWKNGRGVTEELALWPPGASFERGDFDWRVARAGVDAAGPFSEFPGFDRLLVVTEGEGLLLRHGVAAAVRVARLAPHRPSCSQVRSPT
jgi:environmental stress-induced protein Ves